MSIVKDFLLILLLCLIINKNSRLKNTLNNEREYFIQTLNHDLKISTVAQIRGLEILSKNSENEELIKEVQNSCNYTFDMISMLLNYYKIKSGEYNLTYENINILKMISDVFVNLSFKFNEKNLEFNYDCQSNLNILSDKIVLKKIIYVLISIAITNSCYNNKIFLIVAQKDENLIFNLMYKGNYNYNENFATVGHNIKIALCNEMIRIFNGKLKIKTNDLEETNIELILNNSVFKSSNNNVLLSCLQTTI